MNFEERKKYYKEYYKEYREANKDNLKQQKKEYYKEIKDKVYNHYGGYKCNKCGNTIKECLSIDHINNDGAEHRKSVGSCSQFYLWLIDNNFPEGFQILCMNCQWIKRNEKN